MAERNCNTCKRSMFERCETLKNNEAYQNIKEDSFFGVEKHEFKSHFICDDYKSMYIEYPIEVSKINRNTELYCLNKSHIGKFVKIAPCAEECKGKTYLGLFLGDLSLDITVSHNPNTKELNIGYMANPAIFVFELKKIVFGAESWWGIIESPEQLKKITDLDIENQWYVQALRALEQEQPQSPEQGSGQGKEGE